MSIADPTKTLVIYRDQKKAGGNYDRRQARLPRKARRTAVSVNIDADLIEFLEREAYLLSSRPPYRVHTLSSQLRHYLRMAMEAGGTVPEATEGRSLKPCPIVAHATFSGCPTCGLRWDNLDDEPACRRTGEAITR